MKGGWSSSSPSEALTPASLFFFFFFFFYFNIFSAMKLLESFCTNTIEIATFEGSTSP